MTMHVVATMLRFRVNTKLLNVVIPRALFARGISLIVGDPSPKKQARDDDEWVRFGMTTNNMIDNINMEPLI